jgi:hypothetical protein
LALAAAADDADWTLLMMLEERTSASYSCRCHHAHQEKEKRYTSPNLHLQLCKHGFIKIPGQSINRSIYLLYRVACRMMLKAASVIHAARSIITHIMHGAFGDEIFKFSSPKRDSASRSIICHDEIL